jgi:hypothetical protein
MSLDVLERTNHRRGADSASGLSRAHLDQMHSQPICAKQLIPASELYVESEDFASHASEWRLRRNVAVTSEKVAAVMRIRSDLCTPYKLEVKRLVMVGIRKATAEEGTLGEVAVKTSCGQAMRMRRRVYGVRMGGLCSTKCDLSALPPGVSRR